MLSSNMELSERRTGNLKRLITLQTAAVGLSLLMAGGGLVDAVWVSHQSRAEAQRQAIAMTTSLHEQRVASFENLEELKKDYRGSARPWLEFISIIGGLGLFMASQALGKNNTNTP
ncbi:hypothetical protein HY385_01345 [Candidatus Daviesbacteria bacterium]|nr:hypothetical protein [Candidatus Daviesbacteria bacterium]